MPDVLIVTGGSRGIGAAVARQAARDGYRVVINFRRDQDAAARLAGEIGETGGSALPLQADVRSEAEVARLFDTAAENFGLVTALVNSAGVTGRAGPFAEVGADTLRRVMDVNVLGTMLCCREAARRMAASRGGRGGAIVNLSSGAATLGSPGQYVWYAASKAAVDGLTLGLARELMPDGIRVNAVSPGIVDTDMVDASGSGALLRDTAAAAPIGRMARPDEIARAVLWLLSDHASYCAGANLRVAGGR